MSSVIDSLAFRYAPKSREAREDLKAEAHYIIAEALRKDEIRIGLSNTNGDLKRDFVGQHIKHRIISYVKKHLVISPTTRDLDIKETLSRLQKSNPRKTITAEQIVEEINQNPDLERIRLSTVQKYLGNIEITLGHLSIDAPTYYSEGEPSSILDSLEAPTLKNPPHSFDLDDETYARMKELYDTVIENNPNLFGDEINKKPKKIAKVNASQTEAALNDLKIFENFLYSYLMRNLPLELKGTGSSREDIDLDLAKEGLKVRAFSDYIEKKAVEAHFKAMIKEYDIKVNARNIQAFILNKIYGISQTDVAELLGFSRGQYVSDVIAKLVDKIKPSLSWT